MSEVTITAENFEQEVAKSELPVLIDFWASWCGPCMMMGPVVAEIAEEKAGTVKVGKINVDEQPELAQKFGIMSIPTFMLFKNGNAVSTFSGAVPKEKLLEFITQ